LRRRIEKSSLIEGMQVTQERTNPPPLGEGLGEGLQVNNIPQQPFMLAPKKVAHHINNEQDYRRAKSLRQSSPLAERLLWNDLRQLPNELALKFRRQHPVHPYVIDFACISCKLIVEIDGGSHNARQNYDAERSRYLNDLGYVVMRFTNDDIYRNREGVLQDIVRKAQELLQAQPSTPPLTPPQGEGD
jgi:very-short-patch-repair endonuclease